MQFCLIISKRLSVLLLPFLLALLVVQSSHAQGAILGTEWRGEYLEGKTGAFYYKMVVSKGLLPGGTIDQTLAVKITLKNPTTGKTYYFSYTYTLGQEQPDALWKISAGIWHLSSLEVSDSRGKKRRWRGKKAFIVKRLSMSNFGKWSLYRKGKKGIKLKIKSTSNIWVPDKNEYGSLVNIIDGRSGRQQKELSGPSLYRKAKNKFTNDQEMRAALSYNQQIHMVYQLNLFKNNINAPAIGEVLAVHEPKFRSCYANRLDETPYLNGKLDIRFQLSPGMKAMTNMKLMKGSLQDRDLLKCIYYELAQISYPVKKKMVGRLTFWFRNR